MADRRRVRGIAVHRPIVYGSVAKMIPVEERIVNPDHNMRWTVALRSATSPSPGSALLEQRAIKEDIIGGQDDLSHFIKKVSFKLHDSYPNPLRTIDHPPFEVNETGWGEFVILIKIYFVSESAEKAIQIQHALKLHNWTPDPTFRLDYEPWLEPITDDEIEQPTREPTPVPPLKSTTTPPLTPLNHHDIPDPQPIQNTNQNPIVIHSWQYDEILFTEPIDSFYQKLIDNPPTPLPDQNRFPSDLVNQIGKHPGLFGEFTKQIEQNEYKKLNWAQIKILIEIDRLKGKMIRDETKINQLKQSLTQS